MVKGNIIGSRVESDKLKNNEWLCRYCKTKHEDIEAHIQSDNHKHEVRFYTYKNLLKQITKQAKKEFNGDEEDCPSYVSDEMHKFDIAYYEDKYFENFKPN